MKLEYYAPLETPDLDCLQFDRKAREIADFITSFHSNLPFSISINGKWGSGKSTMLNFIETHIADKCDIIRFNPWIISGKDDLLFNLFEQIYYVLDSKEYTDLKNTFMVYAHRLVTPFVKMLSMTLLTSNGDEPKASKEVAQFTAEVAKNLTSDFFNKPLAKKKEELNEKLKEHAKAKKKIVILIDEIDRLFPEEIISIFQMIKSVLDFPGLFFVVAMDESATFDAIKKAGISNPQEYLVKIFPRRYYIYSKRQIKTLTRELLLSNIEGRMDTSYKELKVCIETFLLMNKNSFLIHPNSSPAIYDNIFSALSQEFENPRDFIQFSNILMERWEVLYQDISRLSEHNKDKTYLAFLFFTVYVKYPAYMEVSYYANIDNKSDSQKLPKLIESIYNFKMTLGITDHYLTVLMKIFNGFPD